MTQPPQGFQPPQNYPPAGYQQQPQPAVTPPPAKKSGGIGRILFSKPVIGLAALLVGMGIGGAGKSSTSTTATPAAATVTVTAPAAAQPASTTTVTVTAPAPSTQASTTDAAGTVTDGTYLVGTEIAVGQWKSDGKGGSLCYADTQDKAGNILEQEVAQAGEAVVIRITKDAYTFKSSNCGSWKKVG